MRKRPTTTLFMLSSLDGKITSGANDTLSAITDWAEIPYIKAGLPQYSELEKSQTSTTLTTGRVLALDGVNTRQIPSAPTPRTLIVIDNKPHLTRHGIEYLAAASTRLVLATANATHPAYRLLKKYDNIDILHYMMFNPRILLSDIYAKYQLEDLTIHAGGTINGLLLRADLIDYVHLVLAPLLVGGKDTPTLIDGDSITTREELDKLRPLRLVECEQLKNSYLSLKYQVRHLPKS